MGVCGTDTFNCNNNMTKYPDARRTTLACLISNSPGIWRDKRKRIHPS